MVNAEHKGFNHFTAIFSKRKGVRCSFNLSASTAFGMYQSLSKIGDQPSCGFASNIACKAVFRHPRQGSGTCVRYRFMHLEGVVWTAVRLMLPEVHLLMVESLQRCK